MNKYPSVESIEAALEQYQYIADRGLATSLYLSLKMNRPLFLEGEPGVGKTEIAKVLSRMLDTPLVRLQCYEGLDVHNAVYEWNYARQILQIRMMEAAGGRKTHDIEAEIFGRAFLIKRPLLQSIENSKLNRPTVLLIDELDRADEEFEAFLLELLSDYQITVPEIGTIKAEAPPVVVITSNRTREIHDALKRRCLYFWVDYPSLEKELEIVLRKVDDIPERLARDVVAFVQELRTMELYKLPGVAETLDWSRALIALSELELNREVVDNTLGSLLKYHDDIARVKGGEVERILGRIQAVS